jgi:cyclophilin family peptidyl-prolyl cis-trans isomerase
MRRLAFLLALMAGPAFSAGLEIKVAGESVNGTIKIDLLEDLAPLHAAQITALAADGAYDGVVFHRVINGFMAQTGDVQFGKDPSDMSRAGMGGSDLVNIPAEFSDVPFDRGVVGMARSQSPDSANSQFFIMFAPGYFLNNQCTVIGRVTEGMDIVDVLKHGDPRTGAIDDKPDVMQTVFITD